WVGHLDRIRIEMLVPGNIAVEFQADVITNRIHKSAQAVWLPDFARPHRGDDSGESFLLNIFYGMCGKDTAAQFDAQQVAEIGHKMRFRYGIAFPKPPEVGLIK